MSYTSRFQNVEQASNYESKVYAPNSYSSFIWSLQQPVVERIIETRAPASALDFACGTGRILSLLERRVATTVGVDTSKEMSDIARRKCTRTTIYTGSIAKIPDLTNRVFDLVTCFRFFLNAEPQLRTQALAELREHLAKGGVLVANIHGNARSLRHLGLSYKRRVFGQRHCEMSRKEAYRLFEENGFRIVNEHGFGFLPERLHRGWTQPLARSVDRTLRRIPMNAGAIDLLYVCEKR